LYLWCLADDKTSAESTVVETPTHDCQAVKRRCSVTEISPLPTASLQSQDNGKRRKCKRSEILTSTPVKQALDAKDAARKSGKASNTYMNSGANRSAARKITLHKPRPSQKTDNVAELDACCLYCGEPWAESVKDVWIKCQDSCLKWAHNACAGLGKKAKHFVCEFCV